MYFVALDRLVCQLPMRSDTKDSKARQRRSKMIRLISLAAVFLSLFSGVLRAAVESQLSISAGGAPTSVQLLTGGVVVLVPGTDPFNLVPSTTGTNINANGTIGPWTVDLAGEVGTYPKLLTLDGVLTSATAGTLDIYYKSRRLICWVLLRTVVHRVHRRYRASSTSRLRWCPRSLQPTCSR